MSWADFTNGTFELVGGAFMLLNCIRLFKDKQVKGISLTASLFFTAWSVWNLYYYPSLSQWLSFIGCITLASTNAWWVAMAIYYTRKNKKRAKVRRRRNHTF